MSPRRDDKAVIGTNEIPYCWINNSRALGIKSLPKTNGNPIKPMTQNTVIIVGRFFTGEVGCVKLPICCSIFFISMSYKFKFLVRKIDQLFLCILYNIFIMIKNFSFLLSRSPIRFCPENSIPTGRQARRGWLQRLAISFLVPPRGIEPRSTP